MGAWCWLGEEETICGYRGPQCPSQGIRVLATPPMPGELDTTRAARHATLHD